MDEEIWKICSDFDMYEVSNLEWCTIAENNQHAIDTGLKNFIK